MCGFGYKKKERKALNSSLSSLTRRNARTLRLLSLSVRLILLSVVLIRAVRQPSCGMAERSNLKIPIRKFLVSLSTVSRKEYRVKGRISLTRYF